MKHAVMKKKHKLGLGAIVILCIAVSCLIYTRPQSMEQRYPYLDLTGCIEIKGYCFDAPGELEKAFSIKSSDDDFGELISLIREARFRTRLENLLPQGTKTHIYAEGDYKWNVILCFDAVGFPDGSTGSGDILGIENFYGDLSFSFDGRTVLCSVKHQEQWTKRIMDLISKHLEE